MITFSLIVLGISSYCISNVVVSNDPYQHFVIENENFNIGNTLRENIHAGVYFTEANDVLGDLGKMDDLISCYEDLKTRKKQVKGTSSV